MSFGPARNRVARALLALVALCVMSPGWLQMANARTGFTIKGRVSGLLPGVSEDLVIAIRNPYDFTIVVHGVEVVPGDASDHCRAKNLISPGLTTNVRVKADSLLKVTVPIKLRARAPRGCQGGTFPLAFDGTATRP